MCSYDATVNCKSKTRIVLHTAARLRGAGTSLTIDTILTCRLERFFIVDLSEHELVRKGRGTLGAHITRQEFGRTISRIPPKHSING